MSNSEAENFHEYEYVEVGPLPPDISSEAEAEVLHLSELAAKYAQNVPFRFRVVNGFMAENDKDPTIGVDEVYSLHLVRELKVVVVKHGGEEFEIPVNSTAKFGLFHDVSWYETVDDMMSAKPLPKVVAVKNDYLHADGVVSLQKNEILVIKGVVVKGKFGRGKSALKVFSILSCKELVLPKDCSAQFSTDPEATKLYLTDLLDNSTDFMPCSAKIFPDEDSALVGLKSSVISIERQETHRSVIISLFRDNPNSKRKKETNFIDIPTTIGIHVTIVKTEASDEVYERICKQSEDLFTCYNPSKIQACVDAHSDDQYMTQAQLLAEIRKEKAKSEMVDSAPRHYQQLLAKRKHQETSYEPWVTSSVEEAKPKSNTLPVQSKPTQPGRRQLKPPRPLPSTNTANRDCDSKYPEATGSKERGHSLKQKANVEQDVIAKKPKIPPPVPKKAPVYEEMNSPHPDTSDANRKPVKTRADIPKIPPRSTRPVGLQKDAGLSNVVGTSIGDAHPKSPASRSGRHNLRADSWTGKDAGVLSSDTGHVQAEPNKATERVLSEEPEAITNSSSTQDSYVKFSKTPLPSSGVMNSKFELMSEQLSAVQMTLATIVKQIGEIQTRQSAFENELQMMKKSESTEPCYTITSNMSPADVQKALSAIGLSQYQESFAREAVDGEMFMMLDDEILCNELGVNSKLHRVRLMKMKGMENL